jgi:hypothetical protein
MPTTLLQNPVSMSGGTPAAATTASGVQPPNTLTVQGTAGQATTGTGQTAGAGAHVSITAGTGGNAPGGATTGTGGSVTINPGPPGVGGGTAAAFGNVRLATNGGNVGVATTNPTGRLHVKGRGTDGASKTLLVTDGSDRGTAAVRDDGIAEFYYPPNNAYKTHIRTTQGVTEIRAWNNRLVLFGAGQIDMSVTDQPSTGVPSNGAIFRVTPTGSPTGGIYPLDNTNVALLKVGGIWVPTQFGAEMRGVEVTMGVNQTGSATQSYVAYFANVTETAATGTNNRLIDLQVGGTSRFLVKSNGNVGVGTTTPTSKLHVNGGVQVGNPTSGDMGPGTVNVSGDIYKNGSAYTNPDYVFERHFTGSTQAAYDGPVPLERLEDTIKTDGQLPGIGREPRGLFGRQDVLLEKLEEAYLYIIELTKRVNRLEAALAPASGSEVE